MKLNPRKPRFGTNNKEHPSMKAFHKPQREHRKEYMPGDPRADQQRWDDADKAYEAVKAGETA